MIARLHRFADSLGIKPVVLDAFLATVIGIVANWILAGQPLDINGLKAAAYMLVIGAIGITAPPAAGVTHEAVLTEKPILQDTAVKIERGEIPPGHEVVRPPARPVRHRPR